jgi:hypothetical protein
MNTIVRTGLLLGALVVVWTLVMGYTGWYRDPKLLNLFFVVIPLQVVVMVWGLRKTAAEGRGYGGQVVAGLLMSLVAGVLVVGGSYLFTTLLFPNYFDELAAIYRQQLAASGRSEAETAAMLEAYGKMNNANVNAMSGFMGTAITGLCVSLVAAAFVRKK